MAKVQTAFPSTLPPKSPSASSSLRAMPSSSQRVLAVTPPPSASDLGTLKLLLAFAIILSFGNLGLTIYLNRPKDDAEVGAPVAKAKEAIDEARKVREELNYTRVSLNNSRGEIDKLKTEYTAVLGRLANVTTPGNPVHASGEPVTSNQAGGPPK